MAAKIYGAGIDCVAITDHNSGKWVNKLKAAYAQMTSLANEDNAPSGFREITLFPGVELSVQGGIHLLALFDPNCTTGDIDSLLGRVKFSGNKGDCDAETKLSIQEAIQETLDARAIPILAHADDIKGLLQVEPETRQCVLSPATVKQALEVDGLLAMEWRNEANRTPAHVERQAQALTRVIGSDCHNFRDNSKPGSRYTWVKMAKPTLEGLRLALLDGNEVSIRCVADASQDTFDPFKIPAQIIRGIEIDNARYMGNGEPAKLAFSPFFNAVVGGRGTGKSTVIHALRLAARRDQELAAMGLESEAAARFDAFRKITSGREGTGALKQETAIRVDWQTDDALLRLRWQADGQGNIVEEQIAGQWQATPSQSVNAARFPVRIFSQGQIAALASGGRPALLAIVDEAANLEPLKKELLEAKRTFFTQRARLRELDGKLAGQVEIERRRAEIARKLAALSQSNHATVLQNFARAQQQKRYVQELLVQLDDCVTSISNLSGQMVLDDWPAQHFTAQDADLLEWRKDIDQHLQQVRSALQQTAAELGAMIKARQSDPRHVQWQARTQAAIQAYGLLQQQLAAQGVDDPQAFTRLTLERQSLEALIKTLKLVKNDRQALVQQIAAQQALLLQKRMDLTQARQEFLSQVLTGNPHVRIEVVGFGFDAKQIEHAVRELIDVIDERFAEDILKEDDAGAATSGLAFRLARAEKANKLAEIAACKKTLLEGFDVGKHLRNYLERKHEKPEFSDHILAWFPEDDLRIEYQREAQWIAISEGSQGQRSAALLAFLLAFGAEPIVLDQPEDDLDNHLIYELIVEQIRQNKPRRQLIVVTHNPNVVVNGDAELVHVMEFGEGQCVVKQSGALQDKGVRSEICQVMEGGHEAFARRWKRLGKEV